MTSPTLREADDQMPSDKKGTKILARTFFTQLRSGGYTPNQILDIATELIDLVTSDLRGDGKRPGVPDHSTEEARQAL